MKLFDDILPEVFDLIGVWQSGGRPLRDVTATRGSWPQAPRGTIVLKSDTGVELGNPRDESAALHLWANDAPRVTDGRVRLLGPDLGESPDPNLPFGKAVLMSVSGFNGENGYDRHREIELVRFGLNLDGYMMRAVSQHMREWSRVSKQAIARGFSLAMLGQTLIAHYRELPYVRAVEILFVTSSDEDVRSLGQIGEKAARRVSAMNKMAEELSFDCSTCDYEDVCSEVDSLRSLRHTMKRTGGAAHE